MGHGRVVRAPCLILPLQLLGVTRGISPSLCQRPARAAGSRVGSFWARKRRREPCNDLWEQGDNIPEEQNWEKRTGMDNDPKEQAEQDSPVLARSLIWPQIIFFLLKTQTDKTKKPQTTPNLKPQTSQTLSYHRSDTGITAVVGKWVWCSKKLRSWSVPSGTQLVLMRLALTSTTFSSCWSHVHPAALQLQGCWCFRVLCRTGEFYWEN